MILIVCKGCKKFRFTAPTLYVSNLFIYYLQLKIHVTKAQSMAEGRATKMEGGCQNDRLCQTKRMKKETRAKKKTDRA